MKSRRIVLSGLLVATVLVLFVVQVIPASAASQVTNPGFENGTGTNADNWPEGTSHTRCQSILRQLQIFPENKQD